MLKNCKTCGKSKEISLFYLVCGNKDGHSGTCKNCTKKRVRKYYQLNKQAIKIYDRERNKTPDRKLKKASYQKNIRAKYKGKYKARNKISNAIRDKKIIKSPCVVCGNTKSEAHHIDYRKPFSVIWLCRKHHREEHKKTLDKL